MSEDESALQGLKCVIIAPTSTSMRSSDKNDKTSMTSSIRMITLKHPRTNDAIIYGVSSSNSGNNSDRETTEKLNTTAKHQLQFLEIQSIKEDFEAWVIGENILGKEKPLVHLCTPTDPLLVILPYLISASKKSGLMPLNDMIHDALTKETSGGDEHNLGRSYTIFDEVLNSPIVIDRLINIADSVGCKDLNVWKWNEEKTLKFLAKKVYRLRKGLQINSNSIAEDGSIEHGLLSRNDHEGKRKEPEKSSLQHLRLAWEIVSDYIIEDLAEKLAKTVGLNVVESQPLPIIKKPRTEGPTSTGPTDDYSKGRKVEPSKKSKLPLTSSKLKAASKARAGTKSIASFFGPPPKK